MAFYKGFAAGLATIRETGGAALHGMVPMAVALVVGFAIAAALFRHETAVLATLPTLR